MDYKIHSILSKIQERERIFSFYYRDIRRKLKLSTFYSSVHAVKAVAEVEIERRHAKVLAVIAHITPKTSGMTEEAISILVDRVKHTIDGLLTSFATEKLTIVVKTQPDRHILKHLPSYQTARITVDQTSVCDPMFIGFEAQVEFEKRRGQFDWFLFMEDDIVINDGDFLGKLQRFNVMSRDLKLVLLPNRYEMLDGFKRYIDFAVTNEFYWNRVTQFEIDGIRFSECSNPHAGLYCLSAEQFDYWLSNTRDLNRAAIFGGPRESAATWFLRESFNIYKPHYLNISYFEVLHFDTKYSKIDTHINPQYTFTCSFPTQQISS